MIYFSLAAQSKRNAQCSKNLENLQRWNQRQRPINPREVGQENFQCKVAAPRKKIQITGRIYQQQVQF